MSGAPINSVWFFVIVGLMVVTWVGRALPFWFTRFDALPPRLQRFLSLVPAAAMGALIVPDAFLGGSLVVPGVAIATAAALALAGRSLIEVVVAAISVAWLVLMVV